MNERLALENSPELVDFGTCTLHKVHNSFFKSISSLSLDIDQLANDIFSFFNLSAARREDLNEIRKLLDWEQKFYVILIIDGSHQSMLLIGSSWCILLLMSIF